MAQVFQATSSSAHNNKAARTGSSTQTVSSAKKEVDDQWDQVFASVCSKLPAKDKGLILEPQNQRPFTSTQLFEDIQPSIQKYTKHGFQKFISKLDPVLSHINSFTAIINTFVQTHPEVSGLIWGSLYLLITLAGRAQKTLDIILDFLWRTSPELALFQKWRRLFPERDFGELSKSIRHVYEEVIYFCLEAVKFLRQKPIANFFRVFTSPGMEAGFLKREVTINKLTANVKQEVESAHMHSVHHQLSNIGNIVGGLQRPQNMLTNLCALRMIPHSRNERFFGRSSVLDQMDAALNPSAAHLRQRHFALYGLGGSGKTQIALEYTCSRSNLYQTIIWILASSTEKIDQGFVQVADQFGMEAKYLKNPGQAKDFVLQRLSSSTSDYLLVFDNIDDVSLTADIMPRGDRGAIITASRDSIMSEDWTLNRHQVLEFSIEESCGFLRNALPDTIATNVEHELVQISTMFQGYPLALGEVAGFIRTYGCSLRDFLKIYKDKKSSSAITELSVKDYHANLATVWDLSFSSLDNNSRTILEIFAPLDPDSLSYDHFSRGKFDQHIKWPRLQFMASPLDFLLALRKLRSQSLIRINSELRTISIHRFFQASVREQVHRDTQRRRDSFEEAVHLLTIIQPEFLNHSQHWNPQNWVGSEQYLPHIKALETLFLGDPLCFQNSAPKLAKLVYHGAVYQFERNHYQAATDTMHNARHILEYGDSTDTLLLSDCYRVEGRIFNESNQPLRTLESSKKAKYYADLAVEQKLMDINDSRLPRILTGWGNALNQLGQLEEALSMQLEAIRLCRDVPSDKSDATTIVQLNWAYVLLRLGDAESASRILRSCVDNDPEIPYVIYPLGNAYLALDKVDDALAEHITALKIYVSWFGDQVAVVADSLYKIGEIMFLHRRNADEALPFLCKASTIYDNQSHHYDNRGARARCYRMLGKILEARGEHSKATEQYEKAWTLREAITGLKGSTTDTDVNYNQLLFYWSH